ncbi:MAG: adenylosuccinate lyase [bacterium]
MKGDRELQNISSIDGRYSDKTRPLSNYFSEHALIKKRTYVEIEYLKFLSSKKIISKVTKTEILKLDKINTRFDLKEAQKVKKIEEKINHDVKSVEFYLRDLFKKNKLTKLSPFIHIGLTSSDTNNIAQALLIKDFRSEIIEPKIKELLNSLKKISFKYKNSPMLGRTHGQPAVPTTFGKELVNYLSRLKKQQNKLKNFRFEGKLNGAVGNFNALVFTYPNVKWSKISQHFLKKLGLTTNIFTSQMLPYDNLIEFFQIIMIMNGVLLDLSVDMWLYNMLGIVSLEKSKKHVGSSTMPQKVNPIEFENAEGNLTFANASISFYQQRLLNSRLQRDLSDSTIVRTFGSTFAHCVIAWSNVLKGLSYLKFEEEKAKKELDLHWESLSEAVQTYLKSKGDALGFEKIKKEVYGKKLTKDNYLKMINQIRNKSIRVFLSKLTPQKYIGEALKLVK